MKKSKNNFETDSYSFAYSTKSGYNPFEALGVLEDKNRPRGEEDSGYVELYYEVKGRNGKPVTIVKNLPSTLDLNNTASALKKFLNTGGSVKDNSIIIQGNRRDEVARWFETQNIKTKKIGG